MRTLKTLNQMLSDNPNLLSFVTVPASLSEKLDSATLKTALIRRCGDVAPYYQKVTDFALFGAMWFQTHSFLFDHAVNVWEATYNPIENYDRTETETESGTKESSGQTTDTHSGTDTTTTNSTTSGSDAHSGTDTTTDSVTRENSIAGFNSTTYSDANEETESGTHATQHGETITRSETETGSEALQHGHSIAGVSESAEETEHTRESHIHGNIGVTTAQQMIEAELNLADKFWIYDYIASAFETDNFITVYNSYWEGAQWQ